MREAYADRVEAILASHIDGFKDSVIARRAYSPADLEAMNINLVGGDPYGGSSTIDQSFLWRPFKTSRNHQTGIKASTISAPRPIRARASAAAPASCWRRRWAEPGRGAARCPSFGAER